MTTTPITAQMIFNAAWQKFIIEEAPPAVREKLPTEPDEYSNKYLCSYLTPDGRKCAVGLCIPDGHPAQLSKSCLAHVARVQYPHLFSLSNFESDELQDALHDNLINTSTGDWSLPLEARKTAYLALAERFNLTVPEAPCQTN